MTEQESSDNKVASCHTFAQGMNSKAVVIGGPNARLLPHAPVHSEGSRERSRSSAVQRLVRVQERAERQKLV